MNLLNCLLVLIASSTVKSSKILVVFPAPGTSHYLLGNSLSRVLYNAGHNVTLVSPFQDKEPPKGKGVWTEIYLEGVVNAIWRPGGQVHNLFGMEAANPFFNFPFLNNFGAAFTEKALSHPALQKLLLSEEKFDVVIIEQFVNDALKVLGWHYKVPVIVFGPGGPCSMINYLTATPAPISYVPDVFLSYSQHMTFQQRLTNTLMFLANELNRVLFYFPSQNALLKKHFPEAPSVEDLAYNISLMFVNSHISTSPAKPIVPNIIEIGGFHVNPPKKLPEDLQQFLDNAKEGVIYFSMGSNLKSSDLPKDKLQGILKAFSKLKQKVIWKFEQDLPNKPDNVKIMSWCPQQDILAHPNVKVFISHSGLGGTTETIYHGVPVLCIPIFGDQKLNAVQLVLSGFGIMLPYPELSEETLSTSLQELLKNPKYALNAKKRSKLFHDRPESPKDKIVYWTEYVIRHQGASHLRVTALDLNWYQYYLIDVIGVLLAGLFGVLSTIYVLIKWACCSRKNQISKKVKSN